jgi:glycosyltransferase involved in cell wall biosynthesis
MKVLWITTTPRKNISEIFDNQKYKDISGVWIDAAYNQILKDPESKDIHLDFAAGDKKIPLGKIVKKEKNGSVAYLTHLPKISFGKSGGKKSVQAWKKILDEEKPDVIHLWGCESSVAYDVTLANEGNIPTIIYIQGVIGIHCLYKAGHIEEELAHPRNLWWKKELYLKGIKQKYYQKQAELEKTIIAHASAIITDNEFTQNYYRLLNPSVLFISSPLPIGEPFFTHSWSLEKCQRKTIFTVFGTDPNKGLHQLLKAIKIVKETIPDIKVILPGTYELSKGKKARKSKMSLFEMWAQKFIKENSLQNNLVFVGRLNPAQMADQLEKANLFVSPSYMEVHMGSVREAMVVGTPTISSLCGDALEIIKPGENGLIYRADEYQELAGLILQLLENDALAQKISKNAKTDIREFMTKKQEVSSFVSLYKRFSK